MCKCKYCKIPSGKKSSHRPWRGLHDTLLDFSLWLSSRWELSALFRLAAAGVRYPYLYRFLCICAFPEAYLENCGSEALRTRRRLYASLFSAAAEYLRGISGNTGPAPIIDSFAVQMLSSGFPGVFFVHKHNTSRKSIDIISCIKNLEAETGRKFDWDAFFQGIERYNRLCMLLNDPAAGRLPEIPECLEYLCSGIGIDASSPRSVLRSISGIGEY